MGLMVVGRAYFGTVLRADEFDAARLDEMHYDGDGVYLPDALALRDCALVRAPGDRVVVAARGSVATTHAHFDARLAAVGVPVAEAAALEKAWVTELILACDALGLRLDVPRTARWWLDLYVSP